MQHVSVFARLVINIYAWIIGCLRLLSLLGMPSVEREIELQLVANPFLPSFQGATEAECLLYSFMASQPRKVKDLSICFKNNSSSELPNNPRESLVVFSFSENFIFKERKCIQDATNYFAQLSVDRISPCYNHQGPYIWMLCLQLVELFEKDWKVWPCWRRHTSGGGLWGF